MSVHLFPIELFWQVLRRNSIIPSFRMEIYLHPNQLRVWLWKPNSPLKVLKLLTQNVKQSSNHCSGGLKKIGILKNSRDVVLGSVKVNRNLFVWPRIFWSSWLIWEPEHYLWSLWQLHQLLIYWGYSANSWFFSHWHEEFWIRQQPPSPPK